MRKSERRIRDVMDWLAPMLFPLGGIASLILAIIGLTTRRWIVTMIGVVLSLPILLYLSMTPAFGLLAVVVAVCYGLSVVAVRRDRRLAAAMLMIPYAAMVIGLVILARSQRYAS